MWGPDGSRNDQGIVGSENFGLGDEALVSTVFLGYNMNIRMDGPAAPILFETLVSFDERLFPGIEEFIGYSFDGVFQRYYTWEEAKEYHDVICGKVREYLTTKSKFCGVLRARISQLTAIDQFMKDSESILF
jgi:hypothetical protein